MIVNPKLRLKLPAEGLNHSGGKLVLGKDRLCRKHHQYCKTSQSMYIVGYAFK